MLLFITVFNKARKVILCFQRKDSTPHIKYIDKLSECLSFPTIYCRKTRVDNHLIIFTSAEPKAQECIKVDIFRDKIGHAKSVGFRFYSAI